MRHCLHQTRFVWLLAAWFVCFGNLDAAEPSCSWMVDGISDASVRQSVSLHPGDEIEGIWSATSDGARIAVLPGAVPGGARSFADSYLLVVLKSPRAAILPGTVMGWCSPAAKSGFYDARLFTKCDGRRLSSPKRFTIRINDGSRLSLIEVRDGVEFVAWRLLPYMFRSVLRERRERPRDLDGLLRVWPPDAENPLKPRYL